MWQQIKSWFAGLSTSALGAVLVAVVGIVVIKLVLKVLTAALEKSKMEKAAHSLVISLCRTVMYVLLTLMVASRLGIDVTGIVALASVVTLAISLALQNMLANVVGGFTLLYTHPFHSGDYVEIAGQGGTVLEIGIAYTKLATPDDRVVFIPNSAVTATQIVNYSATGLRRLDLDVSASYNAPIATVLEALRSAAQTDMTLTEPEAPFAAVASYGDNAIAYTLRLWVKAEHYWDAKFLINEQIKTCFDQAGVEMTYPHLNVHLDKPIQ